ncbi:hypothetical protein MMC22_002718 [Lobaria immixta]|nr:hypothetical protein [Lobaria immixta]
MDWILGKDGKYNPFNAYRTAKPGAVYVYFLTPPISAPPVVVTQPAVTAPPTPAAILILERPSILHNLLGEKCQGCLIPTSFVVIAGLQITCIEGIAESARRILMPGGSTLPMKAKSA